MRLLAGQQAPEFVARDIYGHEIALASYRARRQPVLLIFYRSAVCPLCNINLWHLIDHYPDYLSHGVGLLVIVESAPELVQRFQGGLHAPFPLIADQAGELYALYHLESSWHGTARGTLRRRVYREAKNKGLGIVPLIPGFLAMDGDRFRMPAGFLLDEHLTIRLAHYGKHSGDFLPFTIIEVALAALARDANLPRPESADDEGM
ncbi:MAG TPA: redoxin domain-containing protein [Ktedonobacterales bacterium]|nr:redoxin domain-containing protein [Ktedonobacterales bacterium]